MHVRPYLHSDFPQVSKIVHLLHPHWFDYQALKHIPKDIETMTAYVIISNQTLLGFICGFSQNGVGQIAWLGIHPQYHRQNLGTQLLNIFLSKLTKLQIPTCEVETVIEQEPPDGISSPVLSFFLDFGFKIKTKKPYTISSDSTFRRGILVKELVS